MQDNKNGNRNSQDENLNKQQQAVDKAPGEERGQGELVTQDDLKGKKVDADLSRAEEQPIRQLP